MKPTILFIGLFADLDNIGCNNTLPAHAFALKNLGYNIEILTWPIDNIWQGPIPDENSEKYFNFPYMRIVRNGMVYHVLMPPKIWSMRVLSEKEWESAVSWAINVLKQINPVIIHQQFWQSLWWFMEAARRLDIPIVYSAHDYGIACLQTILVTGEGKLCDGKVSLNKCNKCIFIGRNILGKANEIVAYLPFGEKILNILFGKNGNGYIAKKGGVRISIKHRLNLTIERCCLIFKQINHIIVTSPFALKFFAQFSNQEENISVIPWFYSQKYLCSTYPSFNEGLSLALVSRISPEKGVHILLEALKQIKTSTPITLHIAGSINSDYAKQLVKRFPNSAGSNKVIWHGWIPNFKLCDFYKKVHVAVIPSMWYDNCPLSLVEALANGRPVICTNVPSMTHLVKHEVNGLVFPMGDISELVKQIQRFAENPELVMKYSNYTRNVISVDEYATKVGVIYDTILK